MPIQQLTEDVISKIAAGEVVERPASVVKELIENALDAGAENIRIEISGGGRKLIQVSDDGTGIPADEIALAIARHATSKLRSADDLFDIRTLGFRGEALASITAVSRTTILTRHRDEEMGVQVKIEGGRSGPLKPAGAPAGTVISVENLFFNVPARLKFLKTDTTEKRQISLVVMRYALAYPTVRFIFLQDGREQFRTTGSGELADVVVRVFGLDVFKRMIEVRAEEKLRGTTESIAVRGFVSEADYNRKDRSRIYLFVNGRAIQDNSLIYAVTQAYHRLLPRGQYPYAVVMVDVPPRFVDVNVHPTKAEVRFQDANIVFSVVQRAVRSAVVNPHQLHQAHRDQQSTGGWSVPYTPHDASDSQMEFQLPDYDDAVSDTDKRHRQQRQTDDDKFPPEKPRTLPPLRVIGQVGAAYIVAEGPAGMYLIDQHIAHQRVLVDYFLDSVADETTLDTLTPEACTIQVDAEQRDLIDEYSVLLSMLGLTLELFGTDTYRVQSVPALARNQEPAEFVLKWLTAVDAGAEDVQQEILHHLARIVSVKSGQVLSQHEMQEMVRTLERCDTPLRGPFGQPTLLHMSADYLQHEFKRNKPASDSAS